VTAALGEAVTALLDDLDAEERALDDVVANLDDEQWRRATQAPGWDVRDQIIHLAFVEELARMSAAEPDAFAVEAAEAAKGGLAFEAKHLARGRERSGADVLAWWRRERASALDALRARAAVDPGARLEWFGPPMSLRSFATARLMETWAHGWEAAVALSASLPATARLRHIAHLGVTTRGWSYAVRGREPDPTPVRVALAAPDGTGEWTWGPADAAESIRGTALDFCLVVTQRRRWDETDLVADGASAAEWLSLAQAFAGPPTERVPSATTTPTN
jgi:uncharacterized protein (TIGR03084 family)